MAAIFQKESKVFHKIPGGYFAIVGGFIFIALLLVAIVLYSLTVPINWFNQFVSNLGIGPNGSAIAFSIGTFIIAVCLYPLVLHAGQLLWMTPDQNRAKLNNRMVIIAFILAMFAIPGLILVAFFNMGPATILVHGIGATLFFVGTALYGGLFWLCIEIHKDSTFLLRICTLAVLGFFICFMGAVVILVAQNPSEMATFLASPSSYIIRILGDVTDTRLAWIRFFEWWFILAMVAWNLYLGYHAVKMAQKRHLTRGPAL